MKEESIQRDSTLNIHDEVPVKMLTINRDYEVVSANGKFQRTFGAWKGKKCFEVFRQSESVCSKCKVAATFADGKPRSFVMQLKDKENDPGYYRIFLTPHRDEEGTVSHVVGLSIDITEWERDIEQNKALLDNVPCFLTVIDKKFKILTANKLVRDTFGRYRDLHCYESYKNRKTVCNNCPARLVFDDGQTHNSLQEGYDKEGNRVIYMVTVSPYKMKGDRVESVVEMALDVTKTFFLEKELREVRDFQDTVLHNATDGIIASDANDIVTIYNPAAKEILQYPFETVIGKKKGKDLYPPDFMESLKRGSRPVILRESKMRNYKGKEIPVVFSGTQLKKRNGKVVGRVVFFHDLRDIKRLEQEVLDAERLAAVGQTVAGLSHGIKNILMGLEGGVYVVNSGIKRNDNDLIHQGWNMIQNNIGKISSFTKEFLSFARGSTPEVQRTEPDAVARDVATLYRDVTRQSGIDFKTQFQKGMASAAMDPKGIHTCLANLISNAIDACLMSDTEHPEIAFSLFEKKGIICYEIKDNGCGMDYDIKKKIFTNFFTTKGSGQGTGLGLLTTRKIIQEHGGTISFTSSPGVGSVFRIELPRHRLPVPQAEDKQS